MVLQKLIYVINNTVSPFLSRLVYCILNLADKYGISPIPAYIPNPVNVEADCLSWGRLVPKCHIAQAAL